MPENENVLASSSRMLSLLSLLQTRRSWPGPVLAERLEVTPRTVRRDVDRLRELGYAIEAAKGPDGGYRLAAGTDLPPLLFDDDQAVALAVALQHVAASGVDVGEAAVRALATVRQVMPSRLRHRIDGIAFESTPAPGRAAVDPAVLAAVSAAVRDTRTLSFDYAGGGEDVVRRRTEPHALVARGGRWYLVAWDLDRADWRTFRLDRLAPQPGGVRFTRRPLPAPDAVAFVAARARGATARTDDRWPCTGQVDLPLPAREVAPWLGDGTLEELPGGGTRITVGSWSWTGVLALVARFDVPFTIVGPEQLRVAAGTLAARMAAAG
ncbi:helix-turn-helix transcriptional regulator [Pimelobacter simplex]|uniref:helix-turn-helix transcriptional regulator n=1 Tax=Nocardioides simplex TaxID=2045 RepID=UPI0020B145E2|nr:WYL domain-containing protein [Pimelobacter simplex]